MHDYSGPEGKGHVMSVARREKVPSTGIPAGAKFVVNSLGEGYRKVPALEKAEDGCWYMTDPELVFESDDVGWPLTCIGDPLKGVASWRTT